MHLFFTSDGIVECIVFIVVKYLRLYVLLWEFSAFLVLTIDNMGDTSLLVRYIMIIGLRLLTVRADQPQSPDIADHIAIGFLLGYCFPVLIVEEFHQLSVTSLHAVLLHHNGSSGSFRLPLSPVPVFRNRHRGKISHHLRAYFRCYRRYSVTIHFLF